MQKPGHGLGLKFTALDDQDRLHFGVLMKRLYSVHPAVKPATPAHELIRNRIS
jgi:hypothetical protein